MDDVFSFYFLWLRQAREKMVGWQRIGLNAIFGGGGFVPVLRGFCYADGLSAKGRA